MSHSSSLSLGSNSTADDDHTNDHDYEQRRLVLQKRSQKLIMRELLISNTRHYCKLASSLNHVPSSSSCKATSKKESHKRRKPAPISEQNCDETLLVLAFGLDMERNDFITIYAATQHFRRILSKDNPSIDRVIKLGAVRYFVQYLDLKQIHRYFNVEYSESLNSSRHSDDFPYNPRKKSISVSKLHELQYEASWAISNIASGTSEHTKYVVDLGCIPKLIHLLHVENDNLKGQCLLALEKISGGSSAIMRDLVLDHGLMPIVLQILENTTDEKVKYRAICTLYNLLRGNPPPSWEIASTTIPILKKLVLNSSDEKILIHSCWAISFASTGPNERIQAVIEHEELVRKLNELLSYGIPAIQTAALRLVGNLVTGDDFQTSCVLKCGLLENLNKIICHRTIGIRREALWTLSNITAGTTEQIQMVIDAGIITKIIPLLLSGSEPIDVTKEGYWTLSNLCSGGNNDQIKYAIDQGIIRVLCKGLLLGDQQIITVILNGIQSVLQSALALNILDNVIHEIQECGGMNTILDLGNHYDNEIQKLSSQICEYVL